MSTLSDMHLKETRHLVTSYNLVNNEAVKEVIAITRCGLGNHTIVISDEEELICPNCVRSELDNPIPTSPRDILRQVLSMLFDDGKVYNSWQNLDLSSVPNRVAILVAELKDLRKFKRETLSKKV
jgi:hypothetical protein